MYIDESGDTNTFKDKGSKFIVLTGCIIGEKNKSEIEEKFREIKTKFYSDPNIEIKSNFLRYASPDLTDYSSPIKLYSKEKYDELEAEITRLLKDIPISLISVAINKDKYWKSYPSKNPYDTAYIFLMERFQEFLVKKDDRGICIIDPREGTVNKRNIDKDLDLIHEKVRWYDGSFWKRCPNIIERVLFSSSDLTIGIQLADLYCYPIFHVLEYKKKPVSYWRFKETVSSKLIASLKVFP
jgi:hypothetical protein